jgi:CheY-like chemotaxis protein
MSQPRALIIDDDGPIRTMLSTIVGNQGMSVDTARDGVEAIENLDKDGYSLVLLDLMMPRVDGYAVLAHMRKHQPALLQRTILATAVPQHDLDRNLKDPVMVHSKPFDVRQLIADVRHVAQLDAA